MSAIATDRVQRLREVVSETAAEVLESYDYVDMPLERYLLFVLVPSAAFFVVTLAVALVVHLPAMIRYPIPLLGLLGFAAAVFYPRVIRSQERVEMENQYHLVMTHLTVLSTTNIDRMEVFRKIAGVPEYDAFSDEISRVVQLVDTWNQSLDDACRRRAKEVPSDPVADFFERLAYTLGAGQELSDFLLGEQSVMLSNYETVYESALDNLEVMKDLYLSMILSMTFALVFAVVLPVLTGTNPSVIVGAVIGLFIFVQVGFYLAIRTMVPFDPVWYYSEEDNPPSEGLALASTVAGTGLTFVLIGVTASGFFGGPVSLWGLLGVPSLPPPLYICIPLTPLLLPGLVFTVMENRIIERDEEFPSFIRSLGASESAKQSTTSAVLRTLREKDFGSMSQDIDELFKRLNMRIDPERAWDLFAISTQSYLIQKFSGMYLVGRQMGGDPKQLGELISTNMNTVNQLREQRKQATVTLVGLLYGITAASAFSFFIGLSVVTVLSHMSIGVASVNGFNAGQLIHTKHYDIGLVRFLLLIVVLFNGGLSSLMIREVDGGHKISAYLHLVLLTWLGCLTAILTQTVVSGILNV